MECALINKLVNIIDSTPVWVFAVAATPVLLLAYYKLY
ncbi:hypothetical protein [Caudoviricetes sp.]|nr:hypothetical protein [Caudoviricetes sp.]